MKKETNDINEDEVGICEKCGSVLVTEGEDRICPNCENKIDFFGDENDDA